MSGSQCQIMSEWIGAEVIPDDDRTDAVWEMPASSLDIPVLEGPLSQARREDMQAWSFLLATTLRDGLHPLEVRRGDDPPDRVLLAPTGSWGLELTEFTIADVRGELARARAVGRALQEALQSSPVPFEHLRARRVVLSLADAELLPRQPDELLVPLLAALANDCGYVGEGMDPRRPMPEIWPNDRGFYGRHGPFELQVESGGRRDEFTVSASAPASVRRSEALQALAERTAAKDAAHNDVLLMTCRLPDQRGYLCALDEFMFTALVQAFRSGQKMPAAPPRHLDAVVMHLWDSPECIELYRRPGATLPWTS